MPSAVWTTTLGFTSSGVRRISVTRVASTVVDAVGGGGLPGGWRTQPPHSADAQRAGFYCFRAEGSRDFKLCERFYTKICTAMDVQRICAGKLTVMEIKGCGERNASLTFYAVPEEPKSRHRWEGLACSQRAEDTMSGRGLLLCAECANAYGFRLAKQHPRQRVQPPGLTRR